MTKELDEFLSRTYTIRTQLKTVFQLEVVDHIMRLIAQDNASRKLQKLSEEYEKEQVKETEN
jgi:hypothetical protein